MNSMKRVLIVCLILMGAVSVQAQARFSCLDGNAYTGDLHLTLPVNENNPNLEDGLPNPYFITVIGLNNAVPVLSLANEVDGQNCNFGGDPIAGNYSATLPTTGEVPPSGTSAIGITYSTGVYSVDIAEASGVPGEYLLFIDGGSSVRQDREGDVYEIAITPEMVAAGMSLTAYLFSSNGEYDPALALVDADGRVLRDAADEPISCDDAGSPDDCYGDSSSLEMALLNGYAPEPHPGTAQDAMLSLPLTDELADTTLRLRVDTAQRPGEYSLVLHAGRPAAPPVVITAVVTENANHTLTLSCNDEAVYDNGVKILLPPQSVRADTPYRVTVVASGEAVPVLAVFDAANEGICYENSPAATGYEAQLPGVTVLPVPTSAQAILAPDASYIIIGNRTSLPDFLTVFIEGYSTTAPETAAPVEGEGTLPATISGDTFGIYVTPGMADAAEFLTAFLISAVDELDVIMAQVDDSGAIVTGSDGLPAACDNAGVPPLCPEGTSVLNGFLLTLADGRILPTYGLDAMLRIPLLPEDAGKTVRIVTSSVAQAGSGEYVLLLNVKPD